MTHQTAGETLRDRIDSLRQSAPYQHYLAARERVLRMQDLARAAPDATSKPSAYWREELASLEYMLDASPLVVERLRHHTAHITGLRVYDYRSNRDSYRRRFEDKLRALRRVGGDDLLVPESRLLGGFGFDIDGALYNIDTLKYFEVLIALARASVLGEFQGNATRKLVWEIGPGWGGFAYQFKTLCPNVTYVLVDLPELFLFSATYLMTAFPSARSVFQGELTLAEIAARWAEFDFVFLPQTCLEEMTFPQVDLTVNMVSFQEMTTEQVDAYARKAHALGCPMLYSLNRPRSGYNLELASVDAILSRYFWLRETKVMPVGYQKMLDEEPSDEDYRHQVGWRRIDVV